MGTGGGRGAGGVGVIVPYDFALDREMWRWVPEPVSLHVTRTPFVTSPADTGQARLISAPETVGRAARDVLLPGPGVVAYSCTSGSFVGGPAGERALHGILQEVGAPRTVTTAGALADACRALGVTRISLVTPYVDELTDMLVAFLAAHGVRCVHRVGLGLLDGIWQVPADEVLATVRAADRPDAEAVIVSCTNLPTYDAVAPLERLLGKPVLTANQTTMWAALGAIGRAAVGPGQSLLRCPVPDGPQPPVRVAGAPGTGPGNTGGLPSLFRVRVRLPDEPGALARVTTALAAAGCNILALSVHGQDASSVVDELLVSGAVSVGELAAAVCGAAPAGGVLVLPADPHELVDAPTRALDLVTTGGPVTGGLAALLGAGTVETPGPEVPAAVGENELDLVAPGGLRLIVRRTAPFTVTERARAEAFLRAAGRTVRELLLPCGEAVVAGPATGGEVAELDVLLRTCLGAADPSSWTEADLRSVLLPPGGTSLVVRSEGGDLIAVGALLADGTAPEPVLLVHPSYRGMRLGRWLRRALAGGPTLPGCPTTSPT